jgi:hypothetical protein
MIQRIKWFVETTRGRRADAVVEECASLCEARELAQQAESATEFDPETDRVTIYRGPSWHAAKVFE